LFNGVVNNDNVEMKEKAADEFYKLGDNNISTNSNSNERLADHNEN
jgi:hypothetical protein